MLVRDKFAHILKNNVLRQRNSALNMTPQVASACRTMRFVKSGKILAQVNRVKFAL